MNKIFILTLIFFSSISLFSEEKYDFRKARWGMSYVEVMKSESKEPRFFEKDEYLSYDDYLLYQKISIRYHFIDGKLCVMTMSFDDLFPLEKNNYFEEYNNIKSIFNKKYGKPNKNQTVWYNKKYKNKPDMINEAISKNHVFISDSWVSERTIISLSVSVDNSGKVFISVSYKPNEKETLPIEDYLSDKI